MPRFLAALFLFVVTTPLHADWFQWGRSASHDSNPLVAGQPISRVLAQVTLDPFTESEINSGGGSLLVHYAAPLVDGDDVFLTIKTGSYTGRGSWETQTWNIRNQRWSGSTLAVRWNFASDWKPVPLSGGLWEPVFHAALTSDAVWVPGAGGTMLKVARSDGAAIMRVNPFGPAIDPNIYIIGPPTVDAAGNVYYNTIQLDPSAAWTNDVVNSWLVKITPSGTATRATYTSLTPNAPAGNAQCTNAFPNSNFPHPPSPTAVAPAITCGSQRPGLNVAPAVAPDGTIYTVSRAHFTDRWGYLVAANPDLSSKWSSSLRERLNDGCNVSIPPNGTPGGCRAGATTGVDPSDNLRGSGRVFDSGTSSPTVTPDGKILYGAYSRYNYSQGHLMMFDASGAFVGAYGFGWDITPAIWQHDGTYSILIKENRYGIGSYCANSACPSSRSTVTPNDPEQYLITQLSPTLQVEWQFRNTNPNLCFPDENGILYCNPGRPNGFEWCVNAIAVDKRGIVYANSEDGHLYAVGQGGVLLQSMFLRLAVRAAYTPLALGRDGKVYTQNDGMLFVVGGLAKRRAAQ